MLSLCKMAANRGEEKKSQLREQGGSIHSLHLYLGNIITKDFLSQPGIFSENLFSVSFLDPINMHLQAKWLRGNSQRYRNR
jgi:hypothetical protein